MLFHENKACIRLVVCGLLAIWPLHFADAEPWLRSSQRWLGETGTLEVTERQSVTSQDGKIMRVLSLRVPGLIASVVDSADGDFTRLSLPSASVIQMIGQPELPVYRKLLFFDRDARLACNASVTSAREFVLREHGLPPRVFPSQRPIPKVPGALESAAMELHQAASENVPAVPLPVARLTEVGVVRDRKLVLLEVFPVAYDAKTGSVILRESVEAEVVVENSSHFHEPAHPQPLQGGEQNSGRATAVPLLGGVRGGFMVPMRDFKIVEAFHEPRSSGRESAPSIALGSQSRLTSAATVQEGKARMDSGNSPPSGQAKGLSGARLLIIATNQFVPLLGSFVTHKQALGWTVEVLDTTASGGTASAIRFQIQTRYTNEVLRPTHLLLAGDTDTVPAWNGKGAYLPATDLYYACMDGTNDWLPDMAYARFPARTAAQLTNMIAKTVAYENNTTSQTPFVRNAAFVTSEDNYAITEETHNLVVTQHMAPRAYASQKLYRHTFGATTAVVTNSINAGCSLVAYSGHAVQQQWLDPLVNNANVLALTNELRLPLVMSFACDTGSYRDYDESFAEAWLRRAAPCGAVAVLAASEDSYWYEDDVFEKSVFAAIFEDQEPTAGDIVLRAKERYLEHYGPGPETLQYFEQYNLFGDPTLRLAVLEATNKAAPVLGASAFWPDGSFQFTVSGITGRTYAVQTSTNLVDWTPLTSFVSTNAVTYFRDPAATNVSRRFYRAVVP